MNHESASSSFLLPFIHLFLARPSMAAASVVFLVMVLQLGGVPIPTEGNKLAVALWAAWMMIVSLQMLSLPIAIGSKFFALGLFIMNHDS